MLAATLLAGIVLLSSFATLGQDNERTAYVDVSTEPSVEQALARVGARDPTPTPTAAPTPTPEPTFEPAPEFPEVVSGTYAPTAAATVELPEVLPPGELTVALTFYNCAGPGGGFCGTMAGGQRVYEGAAACGYGMALGTAFSVVGDPTGRIYICEDRGAGPYWWIDVFWYDYASGRAWRNSVDADGDGQPDSHVSLTFY